MKCGCGYNLMRRTRDGSPMIDTRGLLLKGGRAVLICPECKGDVSTGGDSPAVIALFLGKPVEAPKKS